MTVANETSATQGVLLTGAAGGMGLETARRFLQQGALVVLADTAPTSGETAAALDERARGVVLDVADSASVAAAFQQADRFLPGLAGADRRWIADASDGGAGRHCRSDPFPVLARCGLYLRGRARRGWLQSVPIRRQS